MRIVYNVFFSKCTYICIDFKISEGGTREMPQQSGVMAALPALGSVPSTHMASHSHL